MSTGHLSLQTFLDAYDAYQTNRKQGNVVLEYNTSQGSIQFYSDETIWPSFVYIEGINIADEKNQELILCQFLYDLIEKRHVKMITFVGLSNHEQVHILEQFTYKTRTFRDRGGDFVWALPSS